VACQRVVGFIQLLNEAVQGKTCVDKDIYSSPTTKAVVEVLDALDGYMDDIPPSTGPRRFGNVAFRDWISRVSEVRKIVGRTT